MHFLKQIWKELGFLVLLTIAFIISQGVTSGRLFHPDRVIVWVFDVGQGDAIFIDAPEAQILIDGGPDGAVIEKLTSIMPPWDRSIDIMINTHPHADHVTGLIHVLSRYQVDWVFTSGQAYGSSVNAVFEELASNQRSVKAGEVIGLGDEVTLTVLWPSVDINRESLEDPNAGSVVALFQYGETSMLLTGDIGVEEELKLIDDLGHIDVLKVGHQGSLTSSASAFLDAIQPDFAIISVGENDYGHPSPIVLDRLRATQAEIFRTDYYGDVRIISDGGEPIINTFDL